MPGPTGEELRVLVVDDNRDGAESLALLLELYGYRVLTADDGYAALAAASSFRPEVVLLDIGLPGLDGYGVIRHLRLDPETQSAYVIAISGYDSDEDRERSRQAGFDLHLAKPVDPELLQRLLADLAWGPP